MRSDFARKYAAFSGTKSDAVNAKTKFVLSFTIQNKDINGSVIYQADDRAIFAYKQGGFKHRNLLKCKPSILKGMSA